jgi:hypothetical protein
MKYLLRGTISHPATVVVEAETRAGIEEQMDAGNYEVVEEATHHIVEFVHDGQAAEEST